jgi:hypothetical protein
MRISRMTILLDAELAKEFHGAARGRGQTISEWMVETASARLRHEAFEEFFAEWEAEHGPIPASELERARRELGEGLPDDRWEAAELAEQPRQPDTPS